MVVVWLYPVVIPVVPNSLVPRSVVLVVLPVAGMVSVVIPAVPFKLMVVFIINRVQFGGVAVVVDIDVAVEDSR